MIRARTTAGASSAALLLCGCTLLLDYPSPGAEVCAGGLDEDQDGLVDCDDPDCDSPLCVEASREQCTDGRDNDGDGRFDAHDLRCWPFAEIEIERCLSTAGTSFHAQMQRDAGWVGAAREGTDPTAPPDHPEPAPVLWLPTGFGWLEHTRELTGEHDGTELWAELYLDLSRTGVVLELVPIESESPVPVSIEVALHTDTHFGPVLRLSVRRPGSTTVYGIDDVSHIETPGGPSFYYVGLYIMGPYVTVTAFVEEDPESMMVRETLPVRQEIPAASRAPTSYLVRLRSTEGDEVPALRQLRVQRPRRDPCGAPVPAALERWPDGIGPSARLDSVARGEDGRLCALAHLQPDTTLSSSISDDGGLRWERTGALPFPAVGAAITFDPATRTFRGAAREPGSTGLFVDRRTHLIESRDCVEWESRLLEDPIADFTFPGETTLLDHLVSYEVTGPRHEVWIQSIAPIGVGGLRSALAAYTSHQDGAPDTFVRSTEPVRLAALEQDEPITRTLVEQIEHPRSFSAFHAGADLALLHGRPDGTVRTYVTTDRAEWIEVEALRLEPSGQIGTLDADFLGGPFLAMEELPEPGAPWRGQLFIQAQNPSPLRFDASDAAIRDAPGWGVLRVTVR